MVGSLGSLVASTAIALAARRADLQRFNEAVMQFKNDMAVDWERLAALCVRAKDWAGRQEELTQDKWEAWLTGNRSPHDYPGLVGIGYAEQVLPTQLTEHEAQWQSRHGFHYQVTPPRSTPRQPVRELEGNPLLPVVVYKHSDHKRLTWQTNHPFLGRDLLHQSTNDFRPWAAARRIEESAARNEIQTSSLEVIAPESLYSRPLKGIEIYVPNTGRSKRDDPTLVLGSKDWSGLAFASIDLERMLLNRMGTEPSQVGFKIFTGSIAGERHDLVADSSTFLTHTGRFEDGRLKQTAELRFYYRRLFIDFWTTPAFEDGSMRKWAWFVGAGGVGMTALAASLVVVQIRGRKAQDQVLSALEVANNKLLHAYQERERISRDLHDGSIQNLYALGLHLQRVQALFDPQFNRAKAGINESLKLLDQSIAELRQFILSTERSEPTHPTPFEALHALIEQQRRTTDTEFLVRLHEDARRLSARSGAHLLRMASEAISNALRHGKARRIELQLERCQAAPENRSRWVFEVRDDGRGFDVSKASGNGLGLKHLKARAAELEGECVVKSELDRGTTIRVVFIDRESSGEVDSSPQTRTE